MGNENSGRYKRPLEQSQALVKADGLTPGHRRLSPKGTVILNPDHSSVPEPPEYGEDGQPLHPAAAELHRHIWKTGYWLWPDADLYWTREVALMQHEIISNTKVIFSPGQGRMIRGDKGNWVEHPLSAANFRLKREIARRLERAGYDPSSRAKLQIAEIQYNVGLAGLAALQEKTARQNNQAAAPGD